MDASVDAGSDTTSPQVFRDINLSRREFEECRRREHRFWEFPTVSEAARLALFYEAITHKDIAAADKVLRMWGIRR